MLMVITNFTSQTERKFYYSCDEKIFIDEVDNKFVIAYNAAGFSDIKSILLNDFKIKDVEWQHSNNICIVTIDASQQSIFKETLLKQKDVKSVQPLYVAERLEMCLTDEFVVTFNADVTQKEMDKLNRRYHVSVKQITDLYQLLSVPAGVDALEIANAYQESGLVEYSHPNFIAKIDKHQIPNDPYFVNQFYLHNTGQTMPNGHSGTSGADINAPEAWDLAKGSSDIIIAVLDEGVTSNHPDLPNTRQVRLSGSNFADGSPNDPSPTGDNNHGNSCAGVIAASHNSEGIAGIAPNCKIMPIRIFDSYGGGISSTDLANAITFAKNNGAHIISNSWGYYNSNKNLYPVIKNAIANATITGRGGNGCVVVFSSGNWANHVINDNGFVSFPSNVEVAGVLTVGASNRYDTQANYSATSDLNSSNNQIIDIVAPSHRAYSNQISGETGEAWTIDIPGDPGYNPVKDSDGGPLPVTGTILPSSGTNYLAYTGFFGGTSCSAPEIAGVAALILSRNPYLTQEQVANIISLTARKAGGYTYQTTSGISGGTWNAQMGHGVLNAYAAVQSACTTPIYIVNKSIGSREKVTSCSDVYIEDVTVRTSNGSLNVNTSKKVSISGSFYVKGGGIFSVQ
jgi:subtilisin family serine protease